MSQQTKLLRHDKCHKSVPKHTFHCIASMIYIIFQIRYLTHKQQFLSQNDLNSMNK